MTVCLLGPAAMQRFWGLSPTVVFYPPVYICLVIASFTWLLAWFHVINIGRALTGRETLELDIELRGSLLFAGAVCFLLGWIIGVTIFR
jgi:hypothetical protein